MMKRSRLMACGLPVIALSLVTACTPSPSTAVQVGDQRATVSQVNDYVPGCQEAIQRSQSRTLSDGLVAREVTSWMTDGMVAQELMDQQGWVVDENTYRQAYAANGNAQLVSSNQDCSEAVSGMVWLSALVLQHGTDEVVSAAKDLDITVNPRYGTWDPDELRISGTGSLSEVSK